MRHRAASDRDRADFSRARGCSPSISASRASATRNARPASRLGNMEFAQADILQAGVDRPHLRRHRIDRRAASSGATLWRGGGRCCRCCGPAGSWIVALYSELGRAEIVAARTLHRRARLSAERGGHPAMPAGPGGIGRRRALDEHCDFSDFFSTSACRDLLFHVQEHRLTLPQINAFLRRTIWNFSDSSSPPRSASLSETFSGDSDDRSRSAGTFSSRRIRRHFPACTSSGSRRRLDVLRFRGRE